MVSREALGYLLISLSNLRERVPAVGHFRHGWVEEYLNFVMRDEPPLWLASLAVCGNTNFVDTEVMHDMTAVCFRRCRGVNWVSEQMRRCDLEHGETVCFDIR